MKQNVSVSVVEEWQTVSCNSCTRHNNKESTLNLTKYTDKPMYELEARSQTTVLCEECLQTLKTILNETLPSEN